MVMLTASMAELRSEWRDEEHTEDVHACFLPIYDVASAGYDVASGGYVDVASGGGGGGERSQPPPLCIMDNGMFPRDGAFVLEAPVLEGREKRASLGAREKARLKNVFVNRDCTSGLASLITTPPQSPHPAQSLADIRSPPDYLLGVVLLLLCMPALPCSLPAVYWTYRVRQCQQCGQVAQAWLYSDRVFWACTLGFLCLIIMLLSLMMSVLLQDLAFAPDPTPAPTTEAPLARVPIIFRGSMKKNGEPYASGRDLPPRTDK